jgi:glycosyltransferase involved in cell wall biosynthesis
VIVLKVMPGVDPCAGAEQSFAVTAPGLRARGVRLHLVVFNERQGLVPEFERDGVVVHDLSSCTSMVQRYRALRRVIRAVGPDVVHATLWEAVVPAQLAAWRSKVPVLVTWANVGSWARGPAAGDDWKLKVIQQVDRVLARVTRSWFHAVTEGVADANAGVMGVPPDRVRVVERGRPADTTVVTPEQAAALRAELGIDASAPVVVAVGRQEPQKDHASLVAAVATPEARDAGIHLVIAGRDGLATATVHSAVDRGDVADRVHLIGHRDDVPVVLEMADVFALSSLYEGAAGAVIEAMRAGMPIVATDVAGQRGVLRHEQNALVVPVADPTAMAAALVRMVTDRSLADRLGAAARATYEERFTIERAVEGLAELYDDIARSRSDAR